MRRLWFVPVLFFSACSEESPPRPPGVPQDAGAQLPDAGVVDAGMSTRDPSCPASAQWVGSVGGKIVDENGAASAGAKAQLCLRTAPEHLLLCLRPKDSDSTGAFLIDIPEESRCLDEATMRLVRPNEDRGVSYCALSLPAGVEAINVDEPFTIYPTVRATTLPPLGDRSTERTIVFAGGLELDVVPATYFPGAGDYTMLAAAPVPTASLTECELANETGFDGVFAFSPEGDFRGRAPLRIPNTQQLAANTPVKIFVLGGLGCTRDDDTVIPEGTWEAIEDGIVSADEREIVVSPGIPCMSWVAYRAD